eukprot:snap_masked-scaffold_12-processed-gene-10.23-mRNA-1 protein AED:0.30 eAED:0.44 QI:0/0/0/0.5/1/1/2/0/132
MKLFSFTQSMFTDSKTHYSDPHTGCEKDEVVIKIQGIKGEICAPECTNFVCPTDEPDGVTAKPMCALQDASTRKKYCTLLCTGKDPNECGPSASCKSLGMLGVCTYGNEMETEYNFLRASSARLLTSQLDYN